MVSKHHSLLNINKINKEYLCFSIFIVLLNTFCSRYGFKVFIILINNKMLSVILFYFWESYNEMILYMIT